MEDDLLTPEVLATMLEKTPASLAQWRYQGLGPRFIKAGRLVRYRRSDVLAWLDANTVQRTGTPASV
jgi:predicted DNA-binding transcriptional regulator AlpA